MYITLTVSVSGRQYFWSFKPVATEKRNCSRIASNLQVCSWGLSIIPDCLLLRPEMSGSSYDYDIYEGSGLLIALDIKDIKSKGKEGKVVI